MRSAQLSLGLPSAPLTKDQLVAQRKHELIRGRPRRLPVGSVVVKISVRPELVPRIDRIRRWMTATRPEFVRSAIETMLSTSKTPTLPANRNLPGRCVYWKIPFSPATLAQIDSLGIALGVSRQKIITMAIVQYIQAFG